MNATVPVLSYQDLISLSTEREAHIAAIKGEVAQDADNLNNPSPLFEQLSGQPAELPES